MNSVRPAIGSVTSEPRVRREAAPDRLKLTPEDPIGPGGGGFPRVLEHAPQPWAAFALQRHRPGERIGCGDAVVLGNPEAVVRGDVLLTADPGEAHAEAAAGHGFE